MGKHFRLLPLLLLSLTLVIVSAASQTSGLVGSWQTKDSEPSMRVTFNADGTGVLEGSPIKYRVQGNTLIVDDDGTINNYTFQLRGDVLTIAGGNIESALTFVRQTEAKGFGRRRTDAAPDPTEAKPKEEGLVGRWQSSEATVQINDDGTLNLNGQTFRYAVRGNTITLSNSEGAATLPFKFSGDTFQVVFEGRLITYKRVTGRDAEQPMQSSGANPQELLGKWCYMSNVNVSGGGRMTNTCFTLYGNGTYDYYSETSSSGPVASSASQSSDSGTWSVSGGTLIANSRARGRLTFSLEKRNHPKTGDPMLVLDGDAFVTYNQRNPW